MGFTGCTKTFRVADGLQMCNIHHLFRSYLRSDDAFCRINVDYNNIACKLGRQWNGQQKTNNLQTTLSKARVTNPIMRDLAWTNRAVTNLLVTTDTTKERRYQSLQHLKKRDHVPPPATNEILPQPWMRDGATTMTTPNNDPTEKAVARKEVALSKAREPEAEMVRALAGKIYSWMIKTYRIFNDVRSCF